jgi:Flp pilus assembly protein TadD
LVKCSLDSRFARARAESGVGIEALAAALKASQQSPHELSQYHIELAKALLAADQPEAALAEVETILRVIPTHPRANLQAAEILAQLGRSEDVLRHLGIYLEVMRRADPGHPGIQTARQLAERYAMAN